MNRFIVEPDYNSPNIFYVFDLINGKKAIAIFYDALMSASFVNWLNLTEAELKGY